VTVKTKHGQLGLFTKNEKNLKDCLISLELGSVHFYTPFYGSDKSLSLPDLYQPGILGLWNLFSFDF